MFRPVSCLTFFTTNRQQFMAGDKKSSYITANEPLEQYVTFWQRAHLFKLEPVDTSASDLLQAMHIRGFTAVFRVCHCEIPSPRIIAE